MSSIRRSRSFFRILFVAVLWIAPYQIRAQEPGSLPGWTAFTHLFDESVDQDKVVGSSIVVVEGGRIIAHHAHGFSDIANHKPVTEQTIFHYGSITKTLAAISIMQLRDRGRLTLDDHVTQYIPELRLVHNPYSSMETITIRMLLSHSAGFQGPTWPYKQGKPWEPFEPTTWAQLVAMMPYQEVAFPPGSQYSYSNPAFIYLARIVEMLSGDPWEVYVQKNIFAPLGLTRSYFGVTPYYLAGDRSHNYDVIRDASGNETVRDNGADFDPGITIPNGGWNAPLTELATYLGFLTNATRGDPVKGRLYDTVLKHSTFEEMWKPLYPTDPTAQTQDQSIGMSFFNLRRGQTTFIGHTGSQAGFLAFMYLNPANKKAVIAAFNTSGESHEGEKTAFYIIREEALKLLE